MEPLIIKPTRNTPEIVLRDDGRMRIKGRSIHENVEEFYKGTLKWVGNYLMNPAEVTCMDIQLEYFNSASAKYIIQVLQKLQHVKLKHKKFYINWYYEVGDEDILERGEYFSSVLSVPFNFIEVG